MVGTDLWATRRPMNGLAVQATREVKAKIRTLKKQVEEWDKVEIGGSHMIYRRLW